MNNTPTQAPTTALEVARYFLAIQKVEDKQEKEPKGEISNLKLQKLLYYAQSAYLAVYATPLFPEPIEAWPYGLVVPDVYRQFKHYGSGPIPLKEAAMTIQDKDMRAVLDDIYEVFGQFSAWRLAELTHEEDPYKEASLHATISIESMKQYFQEHHLQ